MYEENVPMSAEDYAAHRARCRSNENQVRARLDGLCRRLEADIASFERMPAYAGAIIAGVLPDILIIEAGFDQELLVLSEAA